MAEDSAEWLELSERFDAQHPARIVEEEVNRLDRTLLEDAYRGVGSKAHRPDLMLKMVLFEYLEGRSSPAQWSRDAPDHQALRWLGRGIQPSRTAWYEFRDRMGKVIESVHENQMAKAMGEGLVVPERGVQDGSTFRACASRHRLVNRKTLLKREETLQAAIEADGAGQPPEEAPSWMARTPPGRLKQAERFHRGREIVEKRIEENARKPKDKRLKEERVQVSLSEPEAPLGRDKEKVFCPLYTGQFIVEPLSLLVICWQVFAQATDTGTLATMIDRTQQMVKGKLKKIIADSAYATLLDLVACLARGIDLVAPVQENSFTSQKRVKGGKSQISRDQFAWLEGERTYICPQGHRLDYRGKERKRRRDDQHVIEHRYHCSPQYCQGCPLAAQCVRNASKGRTVKRLEGQELLDAQREKMKQAEAKAEYRQRGPVIERAFADAKGHRNLRRLHGHGLARAKAEVGLAVLAQNTLTLHRLREAVINPCQN